VSLRETDHQPVYDWLRSIESRAVSSGQVASAISSGAIGFGAGGGVFLDDFRSKRAPAPTELVNAYKANAYACIQLNVKGVARVPLRLYAKTGQGQRRPRCYTRKVPTHRRQYLQQLPSRSVQSILNGAVDVDEVAEHPFLEALDRPNPFFDGNLFLQYLACCLDCVGTFYFAPVRPNNDPSYAATEFWPLQSQYVIQQKGSGAEILKQYTYFGQTFAPDELVRGRELSMRDPYLSGLAPLHAVFEMNGLANYYTALIEGQLRSGAKPSAIVGSKDPNQPMLPDAAKRLEAGINNRFGMGRQGYVWVVDGSFSFEPIDWPPADMAALEIYKNARLQIANCLGVPISLLQTEDSNRAVAEAGNYQHQRNTIEPRCIQIASALTEMARRVDDRLFFCFDNPVEEDVERRAKVVDMEIKNGKRTINEARADDGDEPVDWGDEPWFSKGQVQPSQQQADREQAQANADKMAAAVAQGGAQDPPAAKGETKAADDQVDARLLSATNQLIRLTKATLRHERQAARRVRTLACPDHAAAPVNPEVNTVGRRGERAQRVWAADGQADRGGAETLVPDPGLGGPGEAARQPGGAADEPPGPEPLRPEDGESHDAAPGGVLAGGG
jgi:HK97 family phage portal protein